MGDLCGELELRSSPERLRHGNFLLESLSDQKPERGSKLRMGFFCRETTPVEPEKNLVPFWCSPALPPHPKAEHPIAPTLFPQNSKRRKDMGPMTIRARHGCKRRRILRKKKVTLSPGSARKRPVSDTPEWRERAPRARKPAFGTKNLQRQNGRTAEDFLHPDAGAYLASERARERVGSPKQGWCQVRSPARTRPGPATAFGDRG